MEKVALNERQIPNCRGVGVALGTGYDPGEGNRRASRNGRVVSSSPTESLTVRFATFTSLYARRHALLADAEEVATWRSFPFRAKDLKGLGQGVPIQLATDSTRASNRDVP
jgi:hypothetical protein